MAKRPTGPASSTKPSQQPKPSTTPTTTTSIPTSTTTSRTVPTPVSATARPVAATTTAAAPHSSISTTSPSSPPTTHPTTTPTPQTTISSTATTTTTMATATTTTNPTSSSNVQTSLPYGAFHTWKEYKNHMIKLIDLEYGLQTQLSPENSFTVDWSVSQHCLTEQMNLIATVFIPYTNNTINVDNLKLGTKIQFLHPTSLQFSLQNYIPITGFVDDIIPEDDKQQYSIDIIIDTISTTFLRNPNLKLPTLSSLPQASSGSPLASPLHSTLLQQQPLSQQAFLKVFASINFPSNGYQLILHTTTMINYHRIHYNLSTLTLLPHLEQTLCGRYTPINNPLEAIGFKSEAVPSKFDIVKKDVIHATTTIPSIFDQQQVDTLHYAIQQPFCIIRAPAGCGKTEIISTAGLKIQAILKRQYLSHQLNDEDYTPVLVTGANEVSLFNEVGKYIFTRSDEVLVISNTFSTKWLYDPILRPTLLQSVVSTWIYDHPDDLLNNFMQRIFPDYSTYNTKQRYILALKLHLIINDDSLLLSLALPGLDNHYVNPNLTAGETGFNSSVTPVHNFNQNNIIIEPSFFEKNHLQQNQLQQQQQQQNDENIEVNGINTSENNDNTDTTTTPSGIPTSITLADDIKPVLLFNPYHFFERLSLLFTQDEQDAESQNNRNNDTDSDNDDNNDDDDDDNNDEEDIFSPEISPLSLQDTLLFCEHYHELQLDLIKNSNIVCCANELTGNKLLFHNLKFHHVLMDDTHSVIEPISLLPLNYGVKQALLSYDSALLKPSCPLTPSPKHHKFSRPLADRLLTLNDWKNILPLPKNSNNIQILKIVPSAHCNVQYRVHPKLFEFPYNNHYKVNYPNLLNQLTLPRDVHAKNYDVLFASVYKKDMQDKHSDAPRIFGAKYFEWAIRRLENDRAGMYNRSLEKFPWPNDQLPFLFLSTTNHLFESQLKLQGITHNTTNEYESHYADCLLAHFVHLGLNLEDLGILAPFPEQIESMYDSFATTKSALTQALYERRLLQRNDKKFNLQLYFRTKLKISLPEHFQSVDCKIIIFSTTRTQSDSLGPILSNPSVINLAMTRARNAVMFLGDQTTLLKHSATWTKLIIYAAENNALMLPTMSKRFIPWLATSRSFIYEMNRRKKEMILHQFLPQLLAQSIHSPPTSKDPIESQAFKQQLIEFEEFDTLLQYYKQLTIERSKIVINHSNELDLYDDGFTLTQNTMNWNNLLNDRCMNIKTQKQQTLGLLVHFKKDTSLPTPTTITTNISTSSSAAAAPAPAVLSATTSTASSSSSSSIPKPSVSAPSASTTTVVPSPTPTTTIAPLTKTPPQTTTTTSTTTTAPLVTSPINHSNTTSTAPLIPHPQSQQTSQQSQPVPTIIAVPLPLNNTSPLPEPQPIGVVFSPIHISPQPMSETTHNAQQIAKAQQHSQTTTPSNPQSPQLAMSLSPAIKSPLTQPLASTAVAPLSDGLLPHSQQRSQHQQQHHPHQVHHHSQQPQQHQLQHQHQFSSNTHPQTILSSSHSATSYNSAHEDMNTMVPMHMSAVMVPNGLPGIPPTGLNNLMNPQNHSLLHHPDAMFMTGGLGSPLGITPHPHSGIISPTGYPLGVGLSPMIPPHQLALSTSGISAGGQSVSPQGSQGAGITVPNTNPNVNQVMNSNNNNNQLSPSLQTSPHLYHISATDLLYPNTQQSSTTQQQNTGQSTFQHLGYPQMHSGGPVGEQPSPHFGGLSDDHSVDMGVGPGGQVLDHHPNMYLDSQMQQYAFLMHGMGYHNHHPPSGLSGPNSNNNNNNGHQSSGVSGNGGQGGGGAGQNSTPTGPTQPGSNNQPLIPPNQYFNLHTNPLIPTANQMNPQMAAAMAAQMGFNPMFQGGMLGAGSGAGGSTGGHHNGMTNLPPPPPPGFGQHTQQPHHHHHQQQPQQHGGMQQHNMYGQFMPPPGMVNPMPGMQSMVGGMNHGLMPPPGIGGLAPPSQQQNTNNNSLSHNNTQNSSFGGGSGPNSSHNFYPPPPPPQGSQQSQSQGSQQSSSQQQQLQHPQNTGAMPFYPQHPQQGHMGAFGGYSHGMMSSGFMGVASGPGPHGGSSGSIESVNIPPPGQSTATSTK